MVTQLLVTYFSPPVSLATALHRSLDKAQVHTHEVVNVHPRPLICTLGDIKRPSDSVHFPQKHRKECALLPSRTSTRSVDVRRAYNGSLELIAVLGRSGLDDGVDVAM